MLLSTLTVYCLLAASVIFGIVCFHFANRLRRRYKELEDYSEEDDYFDATKYDFDEDIYYVGTPGKPKKQIGKRALSKLSAKAPSIGLYLLGVAFISISVVTVVRALIAV